LYNGRIDAPLPCTPAADVAGRAAKRCLFGLSRSEIIPATRSIPSAASHLYLVAPDAREREVMARLARPAFREDLANISLSYIPFGDLCENCDALCRFGEDHTVLRKIARAAAPPRPS
jgi:hypothetical protein